MMTMTQKLSDALFEWNSTSHCGDHDTEECPSCLALREAIDESVKQFPFVAKPSWEK